MKRAPLLAIAGVIGACTFPEINITNVTGNGGAPSGSSTTSGMGGDGAATSSSGGSGGAGGAVGGGGTGAGGMCVGGAGGAGVGGVDPCNVDGDSALAMGPVCCGDDCDDDDADVFPGQPMYFNVPRPNGAGYDYDCNGVIKQKPEQLFDFSGAVQCNDIVLCMNAEEGFSVVAECGKSEDYYKCGGVPCDVMPAMAPEALRCK